MTAERLDEILARFPSLSIAVFGDFYLDKYLIVDPTLAEPSLETGLDAHQVVEIRCQPGAAGNVASNLAALAVGHVHAVGGIGHDGEGFDLTHALRARRIDTRGLIVSQQWRTPCYMKPVSDGRELNRLDIQNRQPPRLRLQRQALAHLAALLPTLDGVLVSDQSAPPASGLVTAAARSELSALAASHPSVAFLADSRANIGLFPDMALKPNLAEAFRTASAAPGREPWHGHLARDPNSEHGQDARATDSAAASADPARAGVYGLALAAATGMPVFVTIGAGGIVVCDSGAAEVAPAPPVDGPIDIVGAGDAAGAALLAALCAGASPFEAAEIANLAASVTIRKLGTTGTASAREIREAFER